MTQGLFFLFNRINNFLELHKHFTRSSTMASSGVWENVYLHNRFVMLWKIILFINLFDLLIKSILFCFILLVYSIMFIFIYDVIVTHDVVGLLC